MIERAAVQLNLRDRADAEAETYNRHAPQVAFEPRERIVLFVSDIDPALDEQPADAHHLGIFSDERTLLCRRRLTKRDTDQECDRHQTPARREQPDFPHSVS